MRVQDEKIKGFNVLELLIVIAIIGVLSAVAYPNFSDWRKDRETRSAVVKIKSLKKTFLAPFIIIAVSYLLQLIFKLVDASLHFVFERGFHYFTI